MCAEIYFSKLCGSLCLTRMWGESWLAIPLFNWASRCCTLTVVSSQAHIGKVEVALLYHLVFEVISTVLCKSRNVSYLVYYLQMCHIQYIKLIGYNIPEKI